MWTHILQQLCSSVFETILIILSAADSEVFLTRAQSAWLRRKHRDRKHPGCICSLRSRLGTAVLRPPAATTARFLPDRSLCAALSDCLLVLCNHILYTIGFPSNLMHRYSLIKLIQRVCPQFIGGPSVPKRRWRGASSLPPGRRYVTKSSS